MMSISVMAATVAAAGRGVDDLRGKCRAAGAPLWSPPMAEMAVAEPGVGPLLRSWRQRRRLSQLDLALEAGVSARHVSFVETGRARPSPEMVLHLADQLEVPLRERNHMLLAAG